MEKSSGDMETVTVTDEDYCSCGVSLKYLTSVGKRAHYLITADGVSQHERFYMGYLVAVMQVDDE